MTETRTFSNVTEAELKAKLEERKRQEKCPTCGARRYDEMTMQRFHADIVVFLRERRVVKYDSCMICVKGHIGEAMTLYNEIMKAKGSGKADTQEGKVDIMLNELGIIGNLRAAFKEAEDWPELHEQIKTDERAYRYEGIGPNWTRIAELIVKYSTDGAARK